MPDSNKISCHTGLGFHVQKNEIFIFDEVDVYLYEQTQAFLDLVKGRKVIALTATQDDGIEGGLEKAILKRLDFQIFYKDLWRQKAKENRYAFDKLWLDGQGRILKYI